MKRFTLLIFALAAWIVSALPLVSAPLEWFETYFHELSHALAAILTGGQVISLEVHLRGSGLATYRGSGFRPLVSFAGYAGAFMWGALIYAIAADGLRHARAWVTALAVMILVTTVLWARDLITILICLFMAGTLVGLKALGSQRLAQWGLQFIGVYVVVTAMSSPLVLLSPFASAHNDAATLAKLTFIPGFVWVLLWEALGLAVLVWLWRSQERGDQTGAAKIAVDAR